MTSYLFNSQNLKAFQKAELEVSTEASFRKIAKNVNFIAIGVTSLGIALTSEPSTLNQPDLAIWAAGYIATVIGPVLLATTLFRDALSYRNLSKNEKIMQASYDSMNPKEKDYIKSQLEKFQNSSIADKTNPILSLREKFLEKQKDFNNKPGIN